MTRSILPASGLIALGLAWLLSAFRRRSIQRLSLPERLQHCADDLQRQIYS